MDSSASNPSHLAGEQSHRRHQSHRGPPPNPAHLGLGESGGKSAEGGDQSDDSVDDSHWEDILLNDLVQSVRGNHPPPPGNDNALGNPPPPGNDNALGNPPPPGNGGCWPWCKPGVNPPPPGNGGCWPWSKPAEDVNPPPPANNNNPDVEAGNLGEGGNAGNGAGNGAGNAVGGAGNAGGDAEANDTRLKTMRILLYAFFAFSTAVLLANWTASKTPSLRVVIANWVVFFVTVVLLVMLEILKISMDVMTPLTLVAGVTILLLGLLFIIGEANLSKGHAPAPSPAP